MARFQIAREGTVAVISLDDGKMNALALEQFDSLSQALKEVQSSDADAAVLTGREGAFSAGLNLKVLPTLEPKALIEVLERFAQVVGYELFMFPKPLVAAVSGHAIAAGAMMALACDVRLFAKGAYKFGLNEVPGGLPMPAFGVELIRHAVAPHYLTEMVMHGKMIDPDTCLTRQIAEAVLDAKELRAAAIARAQQLGQLPQAPYAVTKRKLRGQGAEYARSILSAEMQELGKALGA
jgi:enoyl-CoA hydratase